MPGTGRTAVEGAEGEGARLIITWGSAAVFGAVVECFRAQLGHDRDRPINVR